MLLILLELSVDFLNLTKKNETTLDFMCLDLVSLKTFTAKVSEERIFNFNLTMRPDELYDVVLPSSNP